MIAAQGNNVYTIQLADGFGPTKNVTRREIFDTGEIVLSDSDNETVVSDTESESGHDMYMFANANNDLDVESADEYCDDENDAPQEVASTPPVPPRRSTRSTAGKHSNHHHLPKSAIRTQTVVKSDRNFQEFSDVIANLGAALGSMLSQTWAQYKH